MKRESMGHEPMAKCKKLLEATTSFFYFLPSYYSDGIFDSNN